MHVCNYECNDHITQNGVVMFASQLRCLLQRYNDLTEDECLDLWKCGAKACKLLKRITNGKFDSVVQVCFHEEDWVSIVCMQIVLQDGVTAGQNVMHVHLHVLSTTGEAKYDVSPSERRYCQQHCVAFL
eukprot:Lankesteria_metandrocarpae@DN5095_c0_g1_i4.p1